MITPLGLEDQLLGIVAAKEKPELEEKKNELIIESAKNKKQLKEIEDKILEVLSTSEGNILEDETAIEVAGIMFSLLETTEERCLVQCVSLYRQVLSSSKKLSEEISVKQEIATKTEEEIDKTRGGYKPVSEGLQFHVNLSVNWGSVHTTQEEIKYWGFTLKTHQVFSVHSTPEEFKKRETQRSFKICVLGKLRQEN